MQVSCKCASSAKILSKILGEISYGIIAIMEIWHRGHIDPEHKGFLESNGIKHEPWFSVKHPTQIRDFIFEIAEDDPVFAELTDRLAKERTNITTLFTDEERINARWCMIWGEHSIESLRPEGYGWHQQYYADQCSECGVGWRQIAPFRIKKEPRLGKNQFSSFGSGFELFCTPLVLNESARQGINGFEAWPVMLDKEDLPAESLKQIIVTKVADPSIAEELVEHERYRQTECPVCGKTWHAHYVRGMLPLRKAALEANLDFQLTNEWFGSGANARRETLASQRVVRLILENKWKGVKLVPIQAV